MSFGLYFNNMLLFRSFYRFYFCLVIIIFFGCSNSSDSKINTNSEVQISTTTTIQNLGIVSVDEFGGMISGVSLFQDSLLYVLSGKSSDKIFVIDIDRGVFQEPVPLDQNFFFKPSGIYVHSVDSIFVSEFSFPVIYLINHRGEMIDSYNLYRENLWEMPKEGFANFGLYPGYGIEFQYVPERNSFIVPLKQQDLWYFVDEKSEFPIIGEYDLSSKEFVNLFGNYPGVYGSTENYLLPFYLSHPIIEFWNNKFIVSFSLDPNFYIYDFEGNLLETKSGSLSEFHLSEPLRYDMDDFDDQGLLDYSARGSFYTEFMYVEDKDNFVRIFNNCVADSQGFCKSRSIYALIFNNKLELIEAKLLGDNYESRHFTLQVAYKDGFLSKVGEPGSDDVFPLNDYVLID